MSRAKKKSTRRSANLKKIAKRLAAYSAAAAATVMTTQDRSAERPRDRLGYCGRRDFWPGNPIQRVKRRH